MTGLPCKWLSLALALTLLSACASLNPRTVRYYVVEPAPYSADDRASTGRVLSVDAFSLRVPRYLDRPQIVTRTTTNRLVLAEYHQWGGNLRKDLVRVLGKNLSILLNTPRVHITPRHGPGSADVRVEVEILRFERGPDDRVYLSAQWQLVDGTDGGTLMTRMTELASDTRHPGADYDGMVGTMSRLYGRLASEIAIGIRLNFAAE